MAGESAALALVKLKANKRAIAAATGGIPIPGADGPGCGGSSGGNLTTDSFFPPRGQYFQTSQAMTARVTTGKPTMSASCSARHWMSRLHTEPIIIANATVRMKVLRRSRRHCHHQTIAPSRNAALCHAICIV